MAELTKIRIENPVRFGVKVGVDGKKLFAGLADSVWRLTLGLRKDKAVAGWASAVVNSIEVSATKEKLAYKLIMTALINACVDLIEECWEQEEIRRKAHWVNISDYLFFTALDEVPIEIDQRFFAEPSRIPFVERFNDGFLKWLVEEFELPVGKAEAYRDRIPNRFLNELIVAWNGNRDYQRLFDHFFDHPFAEKELKEHLNALYRENLRTYYQKPVLNEGEIRLSDLYIEPDFFVHERCFSEKDRRLEEQRCETVEGKSTPWIYPEKVTNLHAYLEDFLNGEHRLDLVGKDAGMLVLLGQPGQGKTSFTYRLLEELGARYQHSPQRIFYLKLKEISNANELASDPLTYLKGIIEKPVPRKLAAKGYTIDQDELHQAIIVLDGLDEISIQKGIDSQVIQRFCSMLAEEAYESNGLKIVLTSRHGYFPADLFVPRKVQVLSLAPLTETMQISWLEKFHSFFDGKQWAFDVEQLKEVNKHDNAHYRSLRELINQPILLHLVANADLDIEGASGRASIYQQLFDTLIKRTYDDERKLPLFEEAEAEDLREFLQALALGIYQSDHGYLRKEAFAAVAKKAPLFQAISGTAHHMLLKAVMVSFYFQEVEQHEEDGRGTSEYAVEFLHKSLYEYLAAERIWEGFKKLVQPESGKKRKKPKYVVKEASEALAELAPLIGLKPLSEEVMGYLMELIELDQTTDKQALEKRMAGFLPDLCEDQFYAPGIARAGRKVMDQCVDNFFVYERVWVKLVTLTRDPESKEYVSVPEGFVEMIRVAGAMRRGSLDLRYLDLSGKDLFGANLEDANLYRANLADAALSNANLSNANLAYANLSNATLEDANLYIADLSNANLSFANLSFATLEDANLSIADLSNANLEDATLSNANLEDATLEDANLSFATLEDANLSFATLEDAILKDTILKGAIYSKSQFSYKQLQEAIF